MATSSTGPLPIFDALVLRPFRIEDGARTTGETTVQLDLGGRAADELRTSPDGETWSDWRRVPARATADLEAAEGPQTLFVQLRARGAESPVVRDEITLDLTGPVLASVGVSIASGPLDDRRVARAARRPLGRVRRADGPIRRDGRGRVWRIGADIGRGAGVRSPGRGDVRGCDHRESTPEAPAV